VFERYSEKARRAICYARYEASNYGSRYIETEHLLLGLLWEGPLAKWFPGKSNVEVEIRAEIEKRVTRGERISTSVEVPLTDDCKKILILAAEASETLGHRLVEPEHMLIGILRVEASLAAQLLTARGVKQGPILEQVADAPSPKYQSKATIGALLILEGFLEGLKWLNSEDLVTYFAENAEFIDASGKRWNREEISRGFETLFAPYAKKNATYVVEGTLVDTRELCVANVLWKNALLASEQRAWMHQMSVVLLREAGDWQILLAQVTPVQLSSPPLPSAQRAE
jgi:Clp amino terminal domain, pathogenicity island component